jgi:hypothetical protein
MADDTPAAPAATPAPSAEPTLADLASIIRSPTAPAAARKQASPAQPAPAPAAESDPDFADEPDNLDPAPEATTAEPADPSTQDPAPTPAAEDPAPLPAPEGLDEEDLATRQAFTPDQQKRFDKAMQKKHAKFKEAADQVANLQAELEAARATPPAPAAPTAENPLADVETEAALDARLTQARNLRRWAMTHPNGGTIKDGANDVEITAEKSAELLADATDLLEEHGPKRREYLRQSQALEAAAVQDYPWLKNKTSAGTQAVEAMMRHYGGTRLRDIPGIRGSLADLFMGQVIRGQSKQQAAAKAAPGGAKPPQAPATPAGHRSPPKVAASTKQAASAVKTLTATGADPGNAALSSLISRKR